MTVSDTGRYRNVRSAFTFTMLPLWHGGQATYTCLSGTTCQQSRVLPANFPCPFGDNALKVRGTDNTRRRSATQQQSSQPRSASHIDP
jgi:hypothetical protein